MHKHTDTHTYLHVFDEVSLVQTHVHSNFFSLCFTHIPAKSVIHQLSSCSRRLLVCVRVAVSVFACVREGGAYKKEHGRILHYGSYIYELTFHRLHMPSFYFARCEEKYFTGFIYTCFEHWNFTNSLFTFQY